MHAPGKEFEEEVRRIARILWPAARHNGANIIEKKERDGLFVTDECVHIIECTISKSKKKAIDDIKKIIKAMPGLRKKYPTKAVKGWFITKQEPTPDQRSVTNKYQGEVVCVSYDNFRSSLINARDYLRLRDKAQFGSVINPETGSFEKIEPYVPMDLCSEDGECYGINELCDKLYEDKKIILLGDYGAGKSTTLREMYFNMKKRYLKGGTYKFPVFINLRDHQGQTNPAEALERHGRDIGYPHYSHLVKAWKAGYAVLFLDGFDEIGTVGWVGKTNKLRDLRFKALILIRNFISQSPDNCGFAIAGRANYFDTEKEMLTALGFGDIKPIRISLNDFTEEQVDRYLEKRGMTGNIPKWFPTRPLLLGYLASKKMLMEVNFDDMVNPATGWDILLDKISEREANIDIGIRGETVRGIIERLASRARKYIDGLGPLQQKDITDAFYNECGYDPDDQGIILLQRLPGLGIADAQDGTRKFIDTDFVDAARAGEVFKYIQSPFSSDIENPEKWQCTVRNLGRSVCALRCEKERFTEKKISAALEQCDRDYSNSCLPSDIVQIISELNYNYLGKSLVIKDTVIEDFVLDTNASNLSTVSFQECLFSRIEISESIKEKKAPRFIECFFSNVVGRVSVADLPTDVFDKNCSFDTFESDLSTTQSILGSSLPLSISVLLTILKKVYFQPGAGRKYNALLRGLDHKSKRLVPDIIRLLKQEGLVIESPHVAKGTVWLPVRKNAHRVNSIVSAVHRSNDAIIEKVKNIN